MLASSVELHKGLLRAGKSTTNILNVRPTVK
jgi:hypothetical protein